MDYALYIVHGFGLMKVSEKLGMTRNYWGFIPFLRLWYLGLIAEECDRRQNGESKFKWSAWYLFTTVLSVVSTVVFIVMFYALYFSLIGALISMIVAAASGDATVLNNAQSIGTIIGQVGIGALIGVVVAGVVNSASFAASTVIRALINYRVFKTFSPRNTFWMLLLSIFLPEASSVIFMVFGFSRMQPQAPAPYEQKA